MQLQRQGFPGRYGDAFDLIALTVINGVVMTPWTADQRMAGELRALFSPQLFHHLLDLLALVATGHQQRILGFNHHQILDTHDSHQPVM